MATSSHLRRMITPLARSGKLAKPRQLHNTHWGLVCGQLSAARAWDSGSKQTIIEDFLDEWGVQDLLECSPEQIRKCPLQPWLLTIIVTWGLVYWPSPLALAQYCKVFVNGSWVGVHEKPSELKDTLVMLRRRKDIDSE
eukprot:747983-Amphidinium_carterae.2